MELHRHLWNGQTRLPDVRHNSKFTFTDNDTPCVTYISSNGGIVKQPLNCMLLLPATENPILPPEDFEKTVLHNTFRDIKGDSLLVAPKLLPSLEPHFTSVNYFAGPTSNENGNGVGPGLILFDVPGIGQLPLKVDLTGLDDHTAIDEQHTVLDREDDPVSGGWEQQRHLEQDVDSETTQEEPKGVAEQYMLQRGALCGHCNTTLRSSKLLNTSSDSNRWETTSLENMESNFHRANRSVLNPDIKRIRDHLFHYAPPDYMDNDDTNTGRKADKKAPKPTQRQPERGKNDGSQYCAGPSTSHNTGNFLYEHYAHHPSLLEFARSIINGCHLCSHFLGIMEPDQQRVVENLLNAESRKFFSSAADCVPAKAKQKDTGSDPLSRAAVLLECGRNEWVKSHSDMILRIKVPISGTVSIGELCLYQFSDKDDSGASVQADIEIGIPNEYQDKKGSETTTHLQHDLAQSKALITDPLRFTGSKAAIDLARYWLRKCCHDHHCVPSIRAFSPPTRVIDVGPPDGTQSPRLYITSPSKDAGMEYITLSHCWGKGSKFEPLKMENIQNLIQGFSLERLPETFRDAVIICRLLNVRYLWIDSMCIIQEGDDYADWKREAPKMARVYRRSMCTLAALSSASVNSGCFTFRNSLAKVPLFFRTSANGGSVFMSHGQSPNTRQKDFNLNSRGWVFQERMLSSRTLSFSSDGTSWECDRLRATDRYPRGVDPRTFFLVTDVMARDLFARATVPLLKPLIDRMCRDSFLKAWYEIVQEYSGLELTVAQDKLMAIMGVAEVIQKATGFKWYYGLWHDAGDSRMFLSQLLWHSPYPGLQYHESLWDPEKQTAPSFSWAAMRALVDHRVTFHPRHINLETKFVADWARSSFWLPAVREKDSDTIIFGQCIQQFGILSVQWQPEKTLHRQLSDPAEKLLLEYRTEILHFTDVAQEAPKLILRGPMRSVQLAKAGNDPHYWKSPWRVEVIEGRDSASSPAKDNDKSGNDSAPGLFDERAWFFPDRNFSRLEEEEFVFPAACLTIARWQRAWDERWFCAGIVLANTGRIVSFDDKGRQVYTPVAVRVGYFEHSWESRTSDWENDGRHDVVCLE